MIKNLALLLATFGVALSIAACSSRNYSDTLWQIAVAEDERLLPLDKLDQWLASPDSAVRARVAYAIGIVGQQSSYDRLKTLLKDSNPSVLQAAAFAAGQVADTLTQDLLITLSSFGTAGVKSSALEALSKLGTLTASERLSRVLNDDNENVETRASVAQWMFRLKDENSRNALIAQAMSTDEKIREKVFYSLSRRSVKEAQPLFLLGLNEPIEQIQIFSINGLSRINDTGAAAAIQPLLLSKNPRVQYHAVGFISKFSVSESLPFILNLTKPSNDTYVRIAATQALGKMKSDQTVLQLMDLMTDADVNVACAALVSYASQDRADGTKFANLFATDSDTRKRIAAVQAFGVMSGDAAHAVLGAFLTDSVAAVRGEAFDQIFALDQPELTNRYIEEALSDPDYMPVAIAIGKITSSRLIQFIPMICELYSRTDLIENRQSALDALTELADSTVDKAPLAVVASSALSDREYGIRQRGRALAAKLSIPPATEPDHFQSALTRPVFDSVYGSDPPKRIRITTSKGDIIVELHSKHAPKTVANYLDLVRKKFYDSRIWHRVVPDFVIQDGCPRGDGWGSPGYEIRCEYNELPFKRGTVGMATSGKDTGGSQYFICQSAQPHLDGRYTVFGQVISGMEIVDLIQLGDSIRTVTELIDGD